MIRMALNGRAAVLPVLLGMGASVPLLSFIGLAGVLVVKSPDPSVWLRTVGGPGYAIVALCFVTAANFGAAVAGIFASTIGLRNFASLETRSWATLLLLTISPVALVGALIPELFFAKSGNLLAFIGVAFAPPVRHPDRGLPLSAPPPARPARDLRRLARPPTTSGRASTRSRSLRSPPAAPAHIVLLNPLTYASWRPYRFLTASLPAALVAGLVHALGSRIVRRAGRGGYGQA